MRVSRHVDIPDDEIVMRFSTSGGPGGQHANRSNTRVDLVWNVDSSRALGVRDKQRIRARLRHRIDASGNLRLSSDAHRSQLRNRHEVRRRLHDLVREALTTQRRRVPSAPTQAGVERRLEGKRRRSEVKRLRQRPEE